MKKNIIKTGLCLLALTGTQLQANANSTSTVSLEINTRSTLSTANITFTARNEPLVATECYVSQPNNWFWHSNDNAGYSVSISNAAGDTAGQWDMVSTENNKIPFILLTNKAVDGSAGPAIDVVEGVNENKSISTAGGTQITPDSPTLYTSATQNTTEFDYTLMGIIDGTHMTISNLYEGTYQVQLNINLQTN